MIQKGNRSENRTAHDQVPQDLPPQFSLGDAAGLIMV